MRLETHTHTQEVGGGRKEGRKEGWSEGEKEVVALAYNSQHLK